MWTSFMIYEREASKSLTKAGLSIIQQQTWDIFVNSKEILAFRSVTDGVVMTTFYYYSVNHQSGLPKNTFSKLLHICFIH